jgi:hypothetical protein
LQAIAAAPDIAVGDVLGASVFNLAMLVLVDALYREKTCRPRGVDPFGRAAHPCGDRLRGIPVRTAGAGNRRYW